MDFRKCFVPKCTNTSTNSEKIFVSVPKIEKIRKQWSLAVGKYKIPSTSSAGIYCCEDHFHMEGDCDNWIAYKLFEVQLRIKKDVVPHRNLNGIPDVPRDYSQLTKSEEQIKLSNIQQYEVTKKQKLSAESFEFGGRLSTSTPRKLCDKKIQVHIRSAVKNVGVNPVATGTSQPRFHKKIQVNMKSSIKSIGVNTVPTKISQR